MSHNGALPDFIATLEHPHFAEFGITQSQFRVLRAVNDEGGAEGITPSVLADYLLIERATISVVTHVPVGKRGQTARERLEAIR